MGHRKKSAPRHGSLAYLPRGRASRAIARIRHWPHVEEGPTLLAFAGYKAGMTHIFQVDDQENSPNFGKEVMHSVTVLDAPPITACALRAYTKTHIGRQLFIAGAGSMTFYAFTCCKGLFIQLQNLLGLLQYGLPVGFA